jgi:hypothetical protein
MNINIDEYISFEEKKQIAREAFKQVAMKKSQVDFERILSNSAYDLVREEVNMVFDGNMENVVKEKALLVIDTLGLHTIFSPPNHWDKEASVGWKHLQSVMIEAKPMINKRVEEIIEEMGYERIHELLESSLVDIIIGKLQAKDEN